jgi:hypothetical protein
MVVLYQAELQWLIITKTQTKLLLKVQKTLEPLKFERETRFEPATLSLEG